MNRERSEEPRLKHQPDPGKKRGVLAKNDDITSAIEWKHFLEENGLPQPTPRETKALRKKPRRPRGRGGKFII